MKLSAFLFPLALATATGLASAQDAGWDRLFLRDGRVLEGSVRLERGEYVVERRYGSIRVPLAHVRHLDARLDPIDELNQLRQSGAPAGDLEERARFASLSAAQGRHAEAQRTYRGMLQLDPDHEGARRALGYVRFEGSWTTPAERAQVLGERRRAAEREHARRMRAQGLVEYQGEWIQPAERDRRLAQARERRRAREAEERAERLARLERQRAEREARQREREHQERLARLRAERARAEALTFQAAAPVQRRPQRRVLNLGFSRGTLRYQRRERRLHDRRRWNRQRWGGFNRRGWGRRGRGCR